MKAWLALFLVLSPVWAAEERTEAKVSERRVVYIIPVREDIMPPLVYLIRRGVKEAMDARADLLVFDMHTNGGELNTTEEIVEVINQFKGRTATYVNTRAFSAGAFISVATQKIYMAPGSVIGAAAPILMVPGGGAQDAPETVEIKMTSAVRALVRRTAEKNGHNPEVLEAMIDKKKKLVMDDQVISPEGDILTLTDTEARREYGNPPKPLLSAGTKETLGEVIEAMGMAGARQVYVKPTGAERIAFWLNKISPLLLIAGVIGIYLELKTPGFGLPGIVGITAFVIYFLGGYVAGLSGLEWLMVFFIGLALLVVDIFVFPGTFFLGFVGTVLIFVALLMGMADVYPDGPMLPQIPQLELSIRNLLIALGGSAVMVYALSKWLPRTSVYGHLVSQSASGEGSVGLLESRHSTQVGEIGIAISNLRPGGKAQFGERILDVITQGELISKGARVRIIGHSGADAIVEPAE